MLDIRRFFYEGIFRHVPDLIFNGSILIGLGGSLLYSTTEIHSDTVGQGVSASTILTIISIQGLQGIMQRY